MTHRSQQRAEAHVVEAQRAVSVRDGPNVRHAYDAVWLDLGKWRFIAFWSHGVQYRDERPFDDFSNEHLQYRGFRVERKDIGPGELSAYYSRSSRSNPSPAPAYRASKVVAPFVVAGVEVTRHCHASSCRTSFKSLGRTAAPTLRRLAGGRIRFTRP